MSEAEILGALRAAIVDIMPELDGRPIDAGMSLRDLGLNSLERAEVIIDTMSALDIRASMTAFAGAANLGDIAGIMARAR